MIKNYIPVLPQRDYYPSQNSVKVSINKLKMYNCFLVHLNLPHQLSQLCRLPSLTSLIAKYRFYLKLLFPTRTTARQAKGIGCKIYGDIYSWHHASATCSCTTLKGSTILNFVSWASLLPHPSPGPTSISHLYSPILISQTQILINQISKN